MIKNIIITVLILITACSIALAYRNSKPICTDLIRNQYSDQLICEYGLGDIQEDEADVIIVDN